MPCFADVNGNAKDWPDGSAMSVGIHFTETKYYFLKLLAQKQAVLLDIIGNKSYKFDHTRVSEAVTNQHEAYIAYVRQECELVGALSESGGAWPSTYAVKCEATMIERRYKRVSAAINCIEKLPAEEREFGQVKCLYQLAQLNMGEWKK